MMMNAIVKAVAGPGLELRQVPVPTPGPGEVLIKVHKTAICGTDVHIYNWDPWAVEHIKPPMTIGHEYVGEIAALGEGVTGLKIGPVAFVGIPGEPFTEIGVRIKEAEGWKQIMPVCLTNGCNGYFPSKEAYAAGGYESRSSIFGSNVSDQIVNGCKELLGELK